MVTPKMARHKQIFQDSPAYQAIIDLPVASTTGKPCVHLGIRCQNGFLCEIDFLHGNEPLQPATDPLAQRVVKQLQTYFTNPDFRFDLPLKLSGTDYQRRVWRSLQAIPAGHPLHYGALAKRLKSSARAIGGACRRNPVPIVVPCHRVVAKQGIGGFGGETTGTNIDIKQWLLAHEAQ